MTDIEELVRESLRTAPAVTPSSSDPLGLVSRRVRRARALWGGGAVAVVAVVVAAVVVPLSLRDSAGERLVPTRPSPTASPVARHGVTTWDKTAVAVAAGDGYLWEVRRDPAANDGSGSLVKVDPATHESLQQWDVRAPFDFMTYGLGHAWVWGGGDGGYPDGLLQTFDVSTTSGCPCTSTGYHGAGFGDVAFLGGHAWATAGSQVWEMAPGGGRLWSHSFGPGSAPGRVVAVGGRLFVQLSPTSTQQLIPEGDGVGARLGVTSMISAGLRSTTMGTQTRLHSELPERRRWKARFITIGSRPVAGITTGRPLCTTLPTTPSPTLYRARSPSAGMPTAASTPTSAADSSSMKTAPRTMPRYCSSFSSTRSSEPRSSGPLARARPISDSAERDLRSDLASLVAATATGEGLAAATRLHKHHDENVCAIPGTDTFVIPGSGRRFLLVKLIMHRVGGARPPRPRSAPGPNLRFCHNSRDFLRNRRPDL